MKKARFIIAVHHIPPPLRSPEFIVRSLSRLFPVLASCFGIFPFRHSGYRLVFSRWKKKRYKLESSRRSSSGETDARVATPWHVHVACRPRRIIRRAWSVFSRTVSSPRDDARRRCRRPALLFSHSSMFLLPPVSLSLSVAFLSELRDRQGTWNPLEISAFSGARWVRTHMREYKQDIRGYA